jgi:hypothetical protein
MSTDVFVRRAINKQHKLRPIQKKTLKLLNDEDINNGPIDNEELKTVCP